MAAPSDTIWGEIAGGMARLGLYITTSSTATQTTATIDIWLYTKYSVSDTSNTLYYADQQSNPSTARGSVNIQTTSNNAWNELNQVRIANGIKVTHSRSKSNADWVFGAKLTGVEYVGSTMYVSTTWRCPALQQYKITYNANGGSGAPSAQTKWYGTNITLSTTKPTRTGYTFQGWAITSGGSVAYHPGDICDRNTNTTLYAVWKANTYTVNYNANGGSGAPGSQTKTYGVALVLSSTKPTRSNYNFLGWGTSSSSTTVAYQPGATYSANAGITLYAIWQLAYKRPRITNFSVDRCTSSGALSEEGTYAIVKCNWACDRSLTSIQISYKLSTATSYTNVSVSASGTSGTVNQVIGSALDIDKTYNVRIVVSDSGGSSDSSTTLSPMEYLIDFRPNGVAIGKPAEKASTFDVGYKSEFNEWVKHIGGTWVHWAQGTAGSAGYVKIAQFTITMNYVNVPIKLTLAQRGRTSFVDVIISFLNVNSVDPGLNKFYHSGSSEYNLYLVKSATSTWELYVQKSEAYDNIAVIDYSTNFSHMSSDRITVEWTDSLVSTLPTGYIQSTELPHFHPYDTSANTVRFSNQSMALFGSANDARTYANRKGWIGYVEGGTRLRLVNEANEEVEVANHLMVDQHIRNRNGLEVIQLNADNSISVGNGRRYNGENTNINGYKIALNNNGGGITVNTTIENVSDERFKKDIEDIPDIFIQVWQELLPKVFKWNELIDNGNTKIQFGLIAQDVIEAFQKYGLDYKDYDLVSTYDVKDDIEYFSISYDHYQMLTAMVVRKQQKEIAQLQSEITEIKRMIAELKIRSGTEEGE